MTAIRAKSRSRIFVLVSVLSLATLAMGQEVKFVEVGPYDAEGKDAMMVRNFDEPTKGDGTVSPHAMVAKSAIGDLKIAFAIDADSAEATKPNVIRVDLTGEGKFDNKLILKQSDKDETVFGPQVFPVKVGDKTIPTTFQIVYVRNERIRFMNVIASSGLQAKCKVGEKDYLIRLLDGTAAPFEYAKAAQVKNNDVVSPGSTVAVYVEDSSAKGRKSIVKGFYGQPIPIEGKWYDIALSSDGRKLDVTPFKGELAKVKASGGDWYCRLVGKKYLLQLPHAGDSMEVPADTYVLQEATIYSKPDAKGAQTLVLLRAPRQLDLKKIEFAAGKEASLDVGRLQAKTIVDHIGTDFSFSLQLSDPSGLEFYNFVTPDNKLPPAPKVEVLDSDGKSIYETTMGYG